MVISLLHILTPSSKLLCVLVNDERMLTPSDIEQVRLTHVDVWTHI